jgi:hypothetical protein
MVAVVFVMITVVLGKVRGLASLFGLALSVLALVGGVIPLILQGYSPVWVSLLGAGMVSVVSMLFAHGWNRRSWVAIAATMGTLVLAFAASAAAVVITRLTGVSSDDATVASVFEDTKRFLYLCGTRSDGPKAKIQLGSEHAEGCSRSLWPTFYQLELHQGRQDCCRPQRTGDL